LGDLWQGTPLAFWLVLAACAYFAVMAVRLTVIDVRHHLLPNRIVFPSYGVAGVLLLAAALVSATGQAPGGLMAGWLGVPALRGVAGAATLWLLYFVLRFAYPPGLGFRHAELSGEVGVDRERGV